AKARAHKPKLIIAGASAYPRIIDFARFAQIAHDNGAILMVDMAHIAGIVAAGLHPSPVPVADVTTSTTHKTLRGTRGGIILWNNPDYTKRINSSVFPGTQGGPLEHVIAGKAVAFGEALKPEFKTYIQNVLVNAKALGRGMESKGLRLVTGGTDNHLLLVDLTAAQNVSGRDAEQALESVGITVNKNTIPNEKRSPFVTSGIRVGSAAITTRGFDEAECERVGELIGMTVFAIEHDDQDALAPIKAEVAQMLAKHPLYPELG
ncbi:MAG: serine hydroxymethyltransferase, partial [Coriobacteriales bacterium]|nr:serine hydroxymethyltransferase [Coriobacteriales bacterium]